jgi:predicted acetylornithine/succinylornithine family transaminase
VTDQIQRNYLLANYGRHPIVFERGQGVMLYDADGKEYLDFLAGIAVCSLGHSHPALVKAIQDQAAKLLHVSNYFYTAPGIAAAEAIADHLGGGRVFFCNSGAEANEAAIKLARKVAWRNGHTDRVEIVSLEGSFHGRTLGSLAATIQPAKWEGFGPLPAGVVPIALNDIEALRTSVTARTAAVIFEPIQGEGGIRPVDEDFVVAARKLCWERGAILIADEVQTGMGRTGKWWGFEHFGVRPDVVTLAKGLGSGVPVGAMWVDESFADGLRPGDHGTTFGGGPLVCAAVKTVFDTIERERLVDNAFAMGERLASAIAPLGESVRGKGLLLGLELGRPIASAVVKAALEHGLVVNDVNASTIRLAPPLIVAEAEVDEAASRLKAAVAAVS